MIVFVVIHFHREMLDMEPLLKELNPDVPSWVLYSIAAVVGTGFGTGLNSLFIEYYRCLFVF